MHRNVNHIIAEMASEILRRVLTVTVNITLEEKHLALPCMEGTSIDLTCLT